MRLIPHLEVFKNPIPYAPFVDYELQLVAEYRGRHHETFVEPVMSEFETEGYEDFIAAYYSIYGHFRANYAIRLGGRQCISDCSTLKDAHELLFFIGLRPWTIDWQDATENTLNATLPNGNLLCIYFTENINKKGGAEFEPCQLNILTPDAVDVCNPVEFDTIEEAKAAALNLARQHNQL